MTSSVRDELQGLPPDLSLEPGWFDEIGARVRRRRRRRAVAIALVSTAVVVAVPIGVRLASSTGSDRTIEPAVPTSTADPTPQPGVDAVTALSEPQTHEGSGTETVDLGERPEEATSVRIELSCVTAGAVYWPNGAMTVCDAADGPEDTAMDVVPLRPGQHTLLFRAKDDVDWHLRTTYLLVGPTDWATNAHGDTYGTGNDRGEPDLQAVVATNGRTGYAYVADLDRVGGGDVRNPQEAREWMKWLADHPDAVLSVPVYESDGETVIGEFVLSRGDGP